MSILGLHHITLISSSAARTFDFYTRVLGLRLVKKTVNFDDPSSYHLYFGDQLGRPGTLLTFFEWANLPRGVPGIGGTHHLALQVAGKRELLMWKRRLLDEGLRVAGPYDRYYFRSLYFRDPDGVIVEIATNGPGFAIDEPAGRLGQTQLRPPQALTAAERDDEAIHAAVWPEPVPLITPGMSLQGGLHHISAISSDIHRTDAFYSSFLGLQRIKMTGNFDAPESAHWYWGSPDGRPGTVVTYFEHDPSAARRVRMGTGQTHHFALAVKDEETQLEWREKMLAAGIPVSPVMDRVYFKSIYSRDPDGHIVELATLGPGFLVDEQEDVLGQGLMLPPWLEGARREIEPRLQPLQAQIMEQANVT